MTQPCTYLLRSKHVAPCALTNANPLYFLVPNRSDEDDQPAHGMIFKVKETHAFCMVCPYCQSYEEGNDPSLLAHHGGHCQGLGPHLILSFAPHVFPAVHVGQVAQSAGALATVHEAIHPSTVHSDRQSDCCLCNTASKQSNVLVPLLRIRVQSLLFDTVA